MTDTTQPNGTPPTYGELANMADTLAKLLIEMCDTFFEEVPSSGYYNNYYDPVNVHNNALAGRINEALYGGRVVQRGEMGVTA